MTNRYNMAVQRCTKSAFRLSNYMGARLQQWPRASVRGRVTSRVDSVRDQLLFGTTLLPATPLMRPQWQVWRWYDEITRP